MQPVTEYFKTLPEHKRTIFETIRKQVQEIYPSVTEGISYNVPVLMLEGKALLGFATTKDYLSIYPFSGQITDLLKDELAEFHTTKGTIHITPSTIPSAELIEKIVRARAVELKLN